MPVLSQCVTEAAMWRRDNFVHLLECLPRASIQETGLARTSQFSQLLPSPQVTLMSVCRARCAVTHYAFVHVLGVGFVSLGFR